MQFQFPLIRVFTIPTDAGPGDVRIVIDGTQGRIEFYDATDTLIALIDQRGFWISDGNWTGTPPNDVPTGEYVNMSAASGNIDFGDDDPIAQNPGSIFASSTGAREGRLVMRSGLDAALAGLGSQLTLAVRDSDGRREIEFTTVDIWRINSPCMVAATGPVGTIIGKIAVQNTTETITGFIPVYDTIT